eukprot:476449-Amorphochlora_amoeboformis.AAC.2
MYGMRNQLVRASDMRVVSAASVAAALDMVHCILAAVGSPNFAAQSIANSRAHAIGHVGGHGGHGAQGWAVGRGAHDAVGNAHSLG